MERTNRAEAGHFRDAMRKKSVGPSLRPADGGRFSLPHLPAVIALDVKMGRSEILSGPFTEAQPNL